MSFHLQNVLVTEKTHFRSDSLTYKTDKRNNKKWNFVVDRDKQHQIPHLYTQPFNIQILTKFFAFYVVCSIGGDRGKQIFEMTAD